MLRVHQKGKVSRGILSMSFDNVREIELVPRREIRSRLISGDMKASAFTTSIIEVGGRLHIVNVGRYQPNLWIPPIIGPALIRAETQKQFGEIRAEILRRTALTHPPAYRRLRPRGGVPAEAYARRSRRRGDVQRTRLISGPQAIA